MRGSNVSAKEARLSPKVIKYKNAACNSKAILILSLYNIICYVNEIMSAHLEF